MVANRATFLALFWGRARVGASPLPRYGVGISTMVTVRDGGSAALTAGLYWALRASARSLSAPTPRAAKVLVTARARCAASWMEVVAPPSCPAWPRMQMFRSGSAKAASIAPERGERAASVLYGSGLRATELVALPRGKAMENTSSSSFSAPTQEKPRGWARAGRAVKAMPSASNEGCLMPAAGSRPRAAFQSASPHWPPGKQAPERFP